jgi:hypothetical protein
MNDGLRWRQVHRWQLVPWFASRRGALQRRRHFLPDVASRTLQGGDAIHTLVRQSDRVQSLYFTAPAVSPAMMCFCAAKNTITVGRMVSVMKARISCQSVANSPR